MRRPGVVLIFFALLGLGVSLGFPAEDVLDAVYDESEAVPYEGTPLFSIAVPQASARIAMAELSRGSVIPFNSLTRCCKPCGENDTRLHGVPDSLTIVNHSLRC